MTILQQRFWSRQHRGHGGPIALSLAVALGLGACDDAPTSPPSSAGSEPSAPTGAGIQAAAAPSAGAPYKVSVLLSRSDGTYGAVWNGGKSIQPPYGDRGTLATSRSRHPSIVALRTSGPATAVKWCCFSEFSEGGQVTDRAFYGDRGTFLADINDDDLDDLIAVNGNTTTVKLGQVIQYATGQGIRFATNDINWSRGAFYGEQVTAFADVTGDGWADGIAVNLDGVYVKRGLGTCFTSCGDFRLSTTPERWIQGAYNGEKGTYFADVTGDGAADAINVHENRVEVRRAVRSPFVGNGGGYKFGDPEYWTDDRYYGNLGPLRFQDWDSDGDADAIVVNDWGITVRLSNGSRFEPNWTVTRAFYGDNNTLFMNLNGDKYLDIVALNR
jgi:hypothetical protein